MTHKMDFALQSGPKDALNRAKEINRIESNITSKIISNDDIDLEISEPLFVFLIKSLIEWTVIIGLAFGISLLINKYVLETTQVVGESMSPFFVEGDRLLVNKMAYAFVGPKRGDIIVFDPEIDDKNFVKRVIALPGETIDIKDGHVFINEEILSENYLTGVNVQTFASSKKLPYVLGNDEYFVMGDNRQVSYDSRAENIGTITKSKIKGKVFFMVYPFEKLSAIDKVNY
ncbi:MAG: signal peptidase I [Clostridia bacterium]|nr:signal peptidase I [Clostridia bacterium]